MRLLLFLAATIVLASCHPSEGQNGQNEAAPADASQGIKGVHRDFKGKPAPAAVFNDPDGKAVKLSDFNGQPVLVNLWASWCAPCVKELPTLDQLARSGRIQVLAISEDNGPHPSVVAFLREHRIGTLKSYQDPNMELSSALGPDTVLPTSILFDAHNREIWRYVGDQDWTSAEAAKLLSGAASAPRPN